MRLNRSIPLVIFAVLAVPAYAELSLGAQGCTLSAGQTCTLTALATGSSVGPITWTASQTANPPAGLAFANTQGGSSTNTYTAPAVIAARTTITITVRATADGAQASAPVVLVQPAVTVQVNPASVTLTNGQIQQFTASLQNAGSNAVTWSITPQVGNISANGLYAAPALVGSTQRITVTATSVADNTKSGTASITLSALLEIGGGAPTPAMQYAFQQAFYRNGFQSLASLPPLASVRAFGSTGYAQEFSDAAKTTGVKYGLVTGSLSLGSYTGYAINVMGLTPDLYAYYVSVGANTAGYPLQDAQQCPGFDTANFCYFSLFDKNYALFAYDQPVATGQTFAISGTFYTEWSKLGGMLGPGRPTGAQTPITAQSVAPATVGTTATAQTFAAGAVYSITSGPNLNKIFGVIQPVYDLYMSESGPYGSLGLPTSELIQISTGVYRQTFEGGALQYSSTGGPVLQFPVTSVRLSGTVSTGTTTLNVGQTLTLTATPMDSTGAVAANRPVSWSTTNSKVITIQAAGSTAVVTAVGSGSASVTATSQGITSPRVSVLVIAKCCQIGDGAPTAVQQSFQDALARNKITAQVPAASPAVRVGTGYVQMVQSSDTGAAGIYMLAQSDLTGTAYVATGAILTRYQGLGGPGGPLGYPANDASSGGTQIFANNAALGGNPVRLVSGVILTKWTSLGRELGAAGVPVTEASSFSTFGANSGEMQGFAKGVIYGATAGPRAGQAYLSNGLILTRYNALGGPNGDFGMPVSDEFINGGMRQQNFEGGDITYGNGAAEAVEHAAAKTPSVAVAPASIAAGGRARLAVIGFPNNSTVRVSLTGQPDFVVTTANGSFTWEMFVPLTAKSGQVSIHAVDTRGSGTADGVLTVKGFSDNRVQIAKVQGDNQTGAPGALLPAALRIALMDGSGNPVAGAPVAFQASPGAQLSSNAAITDANGRAEVSVRLPAAEGVAAVTAEAPSIAQSPVTFFVRAAAVSLANFPKLMQAGDGPLGEGTATIAQKGALLTAVASILQYRQNRGELPAPNGPADPAALNQYLKSYCSVDLKGDQFCDGFLTNSSSIEQIVNLWRAADFTGGLDVTVENPTLAAAADLVAAGSPALLSLGLTLNGAPAGGHFVVATGVAADGSLLIHDPNPLFARSSLKDYLNGFSAGGGAWKAELRGVAQFALRGPSATRFIGGAISQAAGVMQNFVLNIQSAAGACGQPFEILDAVDGSGNPPSGGVLISRISVCDGLQPAYQVSVGAGTGQLYRAFVTDLASAGSRMNLAASAPATYKASRPQLNLTLAPQDVSFIAEGVVNAATFTEGIAPGGIMAIFGTGLAGGGTATTVEIDGEAATVFAATPFQVNAQIPLGIAPGTHILRIRSSYGTAQQQITVAAVAPAIFLIGNPSAGAIVNQDNKLNGPSNPLTRGQALVIYVTGLGAVTRQGQLSVAAAPVTALLNGQELPVLFAGLTPGFPGLYQVNVSIPTTTPPGLAVPLTLKQGGALSNTVTVALQ